VVGLLVLVVELLIIVISAILVKKTTAEVAAQKSITCCERKVEKGASRGARAGRVTEEGGFS